MKPVRTVKKVLHNQPTMEGAGVRLHRVFGYYQLPDFDPFLLLDDFGSDDPHDYLAGFPWHPHRGIETVTYMLDGIVEHGDSLGNKGVINSGDVQWMTAGSGIIHQEMPKRFDGTMRGFQLWVNLPKSHKMMAPRYRDLTSDDFPIVEPQSGVKIKIIGGKVDDVQGPAGDLVVDVTYLDVSLKSGTHWVCPVPVDENAFIYVYEGDGQVSGNPNDVYSNGQIVLFNQDSAQIKITAGAKGMRYLLVFGKPLNEPIAWRGPIVMNTDDELRLAFSEYHNGTFIK
ncbi:pirin family protein [candidate division KSB1 bacterium]|nr:pirin family protein [candidate division KSB1 bacterium]